MSRLGAAVLGAVALSACSYYNTLYNSERLFEEAEAHRRAGRHTLASARYSDVIRKTAEAYRGRPAGDDAAATLLLLGRARLRLDQPREARAALDQALALAGDGSLRSEILVYLAFAAERLGEEAEALAYVEEALADGLAGPTLGEAYRLRGRLRLPGARRPEGWDDLARAAATDPAVAVEAGVESLRWGVLYRELDQASISLARLLLDSEAAERQDTISQLVSTAARTWSPSVAATLLGDVDSSPWDRTARSRLALQRARLLRLAGDSAAAEDQAWRVARGRGETVTDARLLLAEWRLDAARDLGDAQEVVPILLPVAGDSRAADVIDAVDLLGHFSGIGLDDPLGWFAAAEVARDRLGAPILARGLYLAYVDTRPSDAWAPKALLGALSVSANEEDRSWIRGRLEAHENSPYVLAARGEPAAGFEALEEDLQERLREISTR